MNSSNLIKHASILALLISLISCKDEPKELCDIPENITYNEHIASIIEVQCFKCHASDVYKEKASRVKIFDYPSLKKMGESRQLVGSITHAQGYIAMPYRKETKIDSCTIETIKTWVKLGMQE